MECARKVTTSLKTLQKKFCAVPVSQFAVPIDIADMESQKLLVVELPISLKIKETLSESSEDVFRFRDRFIIVQAAEPNPSK